MKCKKCIEESMYGVFAGQAFTSFSCPICGETLHYPNTNVPRVCSKCSKQYHICQDCGQVIIDNN